MNATIERTISDINDELTVRLDDLEHTLPTLPAKALSVTRAGTRRVNDVIVTTAKGVSRRASKVGETFGTAGRTTVGQAEAQAERAASTVTTGAKTVAGQARAQAERAASTVGTGAKTVAGQARAEAERAATTVSTGAKTVAGQASEAAGRTSHAIVDETEAGLDEARVALDPDDLTSMTKDELYQRAQEIDLDGRSGMNKAELVAALQQA